MRSEKPNRNSVARTTYSQVGPVAAGPPIEWPGPAAYRPVQRPLAWMSRLALHITICAL
ncbi:MAG: hypothetical protein JWM47_4255 [Acidimicrobiales bacterium]|nr:hypothetical protein [Acidimicrobiales bacterium]